MNILFIGDIFGSAGRKIVAEHIGHIREAHAVDLTVINAENAASRSDRSRTEARDSGAFDCASAIVEGAHRRLAPNSTKAP